MRKRWFLVSMALIATAWNLCAAEIYTSRGLDLNPHITNYRPLHFYPLPNVNHEIGVGLGAPGRPGMQVGIRGSFFMAIFVFSIGVELPVRWYSPDGRLGVELAPYWRVTGGYYGPQPMVAGTKAGLVVASGDSFVLAFGAVGGVVYGDPDIFYSFEPSRASAVIVLPYASLRWTPRHSSVSVIRRILERRKP